MSKFKVEVGNHMINPQSSESYWKRKVTLSFQKIGNENHLLIFCGKQTPLRKCHWMNGRAKWINTLESLGENRMGWVALSLITLISEFFPPPPESDVICDVSSLSVSRGIFSSWPWKVELPKTEAVARRGLEIDFFYGRGMFSVSFFFIYIYLRKEKLIETEIGRFVFSIVKCLIYFLRFF